MKISVVFSLVVCLLLAGQPALAQAGTAVSVPVDTIPGQTLLLRRLSAAMCTQLTAEHRNTDFSKFDAATMNKLMTDLTYQALMKHANQFEELQARSTDAKQMGMWIVQAAHMQLIEQCPPARPLLAGLAMQALGLTAGASAAERTALRPVVLDICHRLDADNARQPFAAMERDGRANAIQEAVQNATEAAIAAHPTVMAQLYGTEAALTPSQKLQIRLKISQLCLEECPTYMVLLLRSSLVEPAALPASFDNAPPLPPLIDGPPPPPPPIKQRRKK